MQLVECETDEEKDQVRLRPATNFFFIKNYIWPATRTWEKKKIEKKSCTHRTQSHVYRSWPVSSQAWHLICMYILGVTLDWTRVWKVWKKWKKERKKKRARKKRPRGFLRGLPLKNPREVSSVGAVGRVRDWWGEGPGSSPTGHKFFFQKLHLTSKQDMREKEERKKVLCTPDTEACVPHLTRVQSSVTPNICMY